MKDIRPKKDFKPVSLYDNAIGEERRLNFDKEKTYKRPITPLPLEYSDIDLAMFNFISNDLDIEFEGKKIPTITLYSNQRFSEYHQSWNHTDNENNLLMNFKTINRDLDVIKGTSQGGMFNIPGDNKITFLIRDVLDNNGTEHYEYHTMKQPFTVDLLYNVNFITNSLDKINEFNMKLNKIFKSKQHYIRPNNHFLPVSIESVEDSTTYSIDEQKFFSQTVKLKVMAYIINSEDFEIIKKPKHIFISDNFPDKKKRKKKASVEFEEYENKLKKKNVDILINFEEYHDKVEFYIDDDLTIENIETDNVRNYRLFINDVPYFTNTLLKFKNGDLLKFKITHFNPSQKSTIKIKALSESKFYTDEILEDCSINNNKDETISIE